MSNTKYLPTDSSGFQSDILDAGVFKPLVWIITGYNHQYEPRVKVRQLWHSFFDSPYLAWWTNVWQIRKVLYNLGFYFRVSYSKAYNNNLKRINSHFNCLVWINARYLQSETFLNDFFSHFVCAFGRRERSLVVFDGSRELPQHPGCSLLTIQKYPDTSHSKKRINDGSTSWQRLVVFVSDVSHRKQINHMTDRGVASVTYQPNALL